MADDANPPPPRSESQRTADAERYAQISDALVAAVDAAVPGWIEGLVTRRIVEWSGHASPEVAAAAVTAGEDARKEVVPALRALVETDVDNQRTNPLSLLRDATRHAHAVLADAGMPAMRRDQFAERSFPDDSFGLVPATWADVDPALHEIGITWGAAKAFLHKARRRDEGRS